MKAAASRVTILTADSDRHPDHFGPEPGVNLLEYLSRHGAHVDIANTSSGRVPIAEAILGEAAARKADLVIVGVYSRPRTTKILFGGVTRSLLSGAHLPLLISR